MSLEPILQAGWPDPDPSRVVWPWPSPGTWNAAGAAGSGFIAGATIGCRPEGCYIVPCSVPDRTASY